MYLTILMVVHILGAVVGIGPTFAFSILGPAAGKAGREGALALLEGMLQIERKLVTPVALVTQPLSGALLIFETGRNNGFFQREWLVVSIVLYATILFLSYIVDTPAIRRVVAGIRDGATDTPEFQRSLKLTQRLGPLFGIMAVTIVILMVWRPGDAV